MNITHDTIDLLRNFYASSMSINTSDDLLSYYSEATDIKTNSLGYTNAYSILFMIASGLSNEDILNMSPEERMTYVYLFR